MFFNYQKFLSLSVISVVQITTLPSFATGVKDSADETNPIKAGTSIPTVKLTNFENKPVELTQLAAKKPSVFVFYRGGWCPFCNAQLSRLGKIEGDIKKLGYEIYAISPDTPASLRKTISQNELNYTLISDIKGEAAAKFGLAFKAPDGMRDKLIARGHDIAKDRSYTLPIPAVYVVSQKGKVLYKFSNPDYSVRLDESELLAQLKKFKK